MPEEPLQTFTTSGAISTSINTGMDEEIRRTERMRAELHRITRSRMNELTWEEEILTEDNDRPMLDKKRLKQQHLNGGEREAYHKPLNDWKETPKGEVCINASSLPVDDIVSKFNSTVKPLPDF